MSYHQNILFDLDGTLTDPGEGIINSTLYALRHLGIEGDPAFLRRYFIGPPLLDSFMKYYGLSATRALEAVELYREYYRERGIFENKLYPGIADLLKTLKLAEKKPALATSKPTVFAREILAYFQIERFFDKQLIIGSYLDGRRSAKAEVIGAVLSLLGEAGKNAVMVGDRKFDILGAQANGLDSIGVTYGYGEKQELETAGATYLVSSVAELGALLLKNDGSDG